MLSKVIATGVSGIVAETARSRSDHVRWFSCATKVLIESLPAKTSVNAPIIQIVLDDVANRSVEFI
jgi:hypothetical protein